MCLDGIRFQRLLVETHSKAQCGGRYEPSGLKKLLRVLPTQDLSRRSGLAEGRLDLLAFIKATYFSGLLGNQVFQALDQDQDGLIDVSDFLEAAEAIVGKIQSKTAEFLFAVLDSGMRGFLTPEDVRAIFLHISTLCEDCGRCRYPGLEESIKEAFKANESMEFNRLLECVSEDLQLIAFLKAAIVNGLPKVLKEWFEFEQLPCCDECTPVVRPLLLDGRKYYAELRKDALLCYNSVARNHLVTVILLRDVYLEDRPGNAFSLGNLSYVYELETDSPAEKTWWTGSIEEIIDPDHFSLSYDTMELIGSGAYGNVYKSVHKDTGRVSAYKVVSKVGTTRKSELAVRWEVAALRCLKHPNVLAFYAVHETKTDMVLVTEYFPEGSLLDWLQTRCFKITEAEAKSISTDLGNALSAMHRQGIMHRDVKLENVMMMSTTPEVHVKLIDFGLCCFLGPYQMTNESVGTLKYVAPEVLGKMRYREKSDCWSLGVLLYVLLQGTMPFGGPSDEDTALSVLKRRLSFSSTRWGNVSPFAVLALSSLLIRNPASRLSIPDFLHSPWLLA